MIQKHTFSRRRYITAGIRQSIELSLQISLWNLIDDLIRKANIEMDYLQVFELSPKNSGDGPIQKITHKQEQPPYVMTYRIPVSSPVSQKIFVIDDIEHSTMLLTEEY